MFFFFNDTATTEIYTLSLHDALPISAEDSKQPLPTTARRLSVGGPGPGPRECTRHGLRRRAGTARLPPGPGETGRHPDLLPGDRKSTRLNSSHANISYAVFCLKKKKS